MKRTAALLFTFILLSHLSHLNAQATAAGNFMFGSRLGFSTADSKLTVTGDTLNFSGKSGSSYQLNIAPSIGYFVANNFALGIGMEYSKIFSEQPVNPADPAGELRENSDSDLLFGPFARLYLPVTDDQAFFLGAIVGFGESRDQFDLGNGDVQSIQTRLRSLSLGLGYTIFASNGFGLETLAKYNINRSNTDLDIGNVKSSYLSRTRAFDFSVGLQIYIGGNGGSSYE